LIRSLPLAVLTRPVTSGHSGARPLPQAVLTRSPGTPAPRISRQTPPRAQRLFL